MKRIVWVCLLILAVGLVGCSGSSKADELYETAQFEERQRNQAHAIQLYEQLVTEYPNSDVARKAKERLDRLRQNSSLQ